jgi:hypothetical protein
MLPPPKIAGSTKPLTNDDTQRRLPADPDRSAESLGAIDFEIVPAHPMPLEAFY